MLGFFSILLLASAFNGMHRTLQGASDSKGGDGVLLFNITLNRYGDLIFVPSLNRIHRTVILSQITLCFQEELYKYAITQTIWVLVGAEAQVKGESVHDLK